MHTLKIGNRTITVERTPDYPTWKIRCGEWYDSVSNAFLVGATLYQFRFDYTDGQHSCIPGSGPFSHRCGICDAFLRLPEFHSGYISSHKMRRPYTNR